MYRRVRFTNQHAISVFGISSENKGLRPNTCQHFRQRSGNFTYHRRFQNQVHSRSLNTRCPTTAKVRAALIDLILEVRSLELNIFADLKVELEQADRTACSLTKGIIETCLKELPAADQAFTPLEDHQHAENARQYADKVRTICRLNTGNDTNDTGNDTSNTKPDERRSSLAKVIPDIDTLTERCCSNKGKLGIWKPHQIARNTYRTRRVVQMFKASSGITCVTDIEKSDVVQFKETLLETYAISSASTMFNQLGA
ncbi:hypothetical protein NX722_21840 [Endozoicomonas gorgoniicola]|uniref:Uncharacterized protein n=1 Tax=Endozoicomonas gorgoniicola TaxID=1234144 RepID=A0ABT3N0R6_9GAMM|nr:hypothetical protein [Endozoicomonas gorgoniicola]MCW7555217.1 hypothetical protein [Endozoicomonas gorgoniicola]